MGASGAEAVESAISRQSLLASGLRQTKVKSGAVVEGATDMRSLLASGIKQ
jgi:hypothetical protein